MAFTFSGGWAGIFGAIFLDYRTFRDMLQQYNEVVMFVPGDNLDTTLSGVYRDSFRSDKIEIKELLLLDGLRKVATRIPHQSGRPKNQWDASLLDSCPQLRMPRYNDGMQATVARDEVMCQCVRTTNGPTKCATSAARYSGSDKSVQATASQE